MTAHDLSAHCLRDLLNQENHGVEYQPIIDLASGQVHAYEALARFNDQLGQPLSPATVFRAFHESPLSLFELEYRVKKTQIRNAPPGVPVFLNIDQDAFATFEDCACHPLVDLFDGERELVVEIIENSSISDARISLSMLKTFRERNVPLALDDIGASETLVSFDVLAGVDYLKLARDCLSRQNEPAFAALLRAIRDFANATGKIIVVEGAETAEQLGWAREFGAQLVQGFAFRSQFIRVSPEDGHAAAAPAGSFVPLDGLRTGGGSVGLRTL